MPLDIILYALIALGLILWLRSVLGTRHGDEASRPNPFAAPPRPADGAARPAMAARLPGPPPATGGLERHMAISKGAAEQGLADIARADRAFDPAHFLKGAQDAFVMIVEAFSRGDRPTLQDLLSPPVLDAFSRVIEQREKNGEKASVEIHAVRRAEITDARIDKGQARITVRFTADETYVLRGAEGQVKEGNPDRVSETIDIWTFARDVRSRNPAWLVAETRDEDAATGGNIVIPDAV